MSVEEITMGIKIDGQAMFEALVEQAIRECVGVDPILQELVDKFDELKAAGRNPVFLIDEQNKRITLMERTPVTATLGEFEDEEDKE